MKQQTEEKEMITLAQLLAGERKLKRPDPEIFRQVKERWDTVAKPLDSLGDFEEITAWIGAIQGTMDIDVSKKAVIAFCADNGIVEEGVSQCGQEVTLAVAKAMGKGTSSVCKMARHIGAEVIPVDIGIASSEEIPGVRSRKVAQGTRNFAKGPAMRWEEAVQAIQIGMDLAQEAYRNGFRLLCTGEMGIGNTTTSAAVAAALLDCPPEEITGRGSGLSDSALEGKIRIIRQALERYDLAGVNPIGVLSCVGGLDIAGMAGVMIGGAAVGLPVVLDGVISCVAALVAVRLFPEVEDYLIASHLSKEPAARRILTGLKKKPVIRAGMALGEGTGAVMFCALLDLALTLYSKQLTFGDLEMEAYTRFED